jgi:hypothetical protein
MSTATMRRKQVTTELTDLDVERVDGVDKPATGRKFLMIKNEKGGLDVVARPVAKSGAVREFLPTGETEVDSTARAMNRWNGKGTAEIPKPWRPENDFGPVDSWLFGDSSGAASKPESKLPRDGSGYTNEETFSPRPDGLNFRPADAHGMPDNEEYQPSMPGPVKMGDGYVLKSAEFLTRPVRKSADFWKGTVAHRGMTKIEAMHAGAAIERCFAPLRVGEIMKATGDTESDWFTIHGPSRG